MTSVGFDENTIIKYLIYDKKYTTNALKLWDTLSNTCGVNLDISLYTYFINLTNVKICNNKVGIYKSLMKFTKEICKEWCKVTFDDDSVINVGLDTEFTIEHRPFIIDDIAIGSKITNRYIMNNNGPILNKEVKSIERYTEAKYAYDVIVDNRF